MKYRKIKHLLIAFLLITSPNLLAQVFQPLITHGPYLQYLTPTEVTIIWTTSVDCISWVEAFEDDGSIIYAKERPKFYAAEDGLKTIGMIHKVNINDLKPSTKYIYRIYSKEVKNSNYRDPVFGRTTATAPGKLLSFTTEGNIKEQTSCVVICDMHSDANKTGTLLNDINWKSTDFVVSNGDIMSNFNQENDLFSVIDTCVDIFAKEKPFYLIRGNHETRGNMAGYLRDYVYFPENRAYYTFTSGNTLFIVLDCGEDKPDSDIEYSDLVEFDIYRTKEALWLKNLVESDNFKAAKHVIVFLHMPPYFPNRTPWHGQIECMEKFVPVLNKAGIDLMISGHTHSYAFIDKKDGENNFPIIVMNNHCRMDLTVGSSGIKTTVTDIDKKVLLQKDFK